MISAILPIKLQNCLYKRKALCDARVTDHVLVSMRRVIVLALWKQFPTYAMYVSLINIRM